MKQGHVLMTIGIAVAALIGFELYRSLTPATHTDHDHALENLDAGGFLRLQRADGSWRNMVGAPGKVLVLHWVSIVPGTSMQELASLQAGVNREHDELRAYIRSLADVDATRAAAPQPRHDATVSIDARFHGPAAVVEHVLLLMLEGIRNVRAHARATTAVVEARDDGNEVRLTIDDDGIGFDEGAPPPWSMVSRVKECGGHIAIRGQGQLGAHLVIELPQGEA